MSNKKSVTSLENKATIIRRRIGIMRQNAVIISHWVNVRNTQIKIEEINDNLDDYIECGAAAVDPHSGKTKIQKQKHFDHAF